MAEPTTPNQQPLTPAEQRRRGLHRSRWVAVGVSVGAAALLTGVIAGVNSAPSSGASSQVQVANQPLADNQTQPYQVSPRYTPQYPQYTPQYNQPQTRTHGS